MIKEFHKTGYKGFFQMSENTSKNKPREIHRIKTTKEKDLL